MVEGCGFMRGFRQTGHSIFAHSLAIALRGFCLNPPRIPPLVRGGEGGGSGCRQKNPLKYHALSVFVGIC